MTMPTNSIETVTKFAAVLDKVYKKGSCFSNLDPSPTAIQPTDQAGVFKIQKIVLTGLGDYSKTTGFPKGKITVSWELVQYTQDRARAFQVDALDETEAMGVFGNVSTEFTRVHTVPEIDAYRCAKLCSDFGIDVKADLSTAAGWISALNTAYEALAARGVDLSRLVLYITSAGKHKVDISVPATDGVTDVFTKVSEVVEVSVDRFYSAITLDDGSEEDEGGYAKAVGAYDVNFILMDKGAAWADAKHQAMRVWSPRGENGYAQNPDGDAWKYEYRIAHDCFTYENRVEGGYVHTGATALAS